MADFYDTLPLSVQARYNRDGTLKDRDRLIAEGKHAIVNAMEADIQMQIADREKLDRTYLERCGQTWTDMELERNANKIEYNRKFPDRKKLALENGEDLSELPEYMDQDEYYDLI